MRRSMTKSPLLRYPDEVKCWSDVPVGGSCIFRCDILNVPGYPLIKEVYPRTKDDYGNTIYLMIDDNEFVETIFYPDGHVQ